jgi:hypothetical protein
MKRMLMRLLAILDARAQRLMAAPPPLYCRFKSMAQRLDLMLLKRQQRGGRQPCMLFLKRQ